jgi:radical SAM family uncharacterized protein/radical SAM-linked protein
MTRLDQTTVENLLSRVQKPGRYMGRELNVIVKENAPFRMALSYPDLYEVGMANNGLRILYDIVNAMPEAACERVFAAADDFESALRESGTPLFTLETFTPLRDLDIIGFNVSHELLCTNILQILDLGGVPLRAGDRRDGDPVVIAGGEAVSNPFPLADFIDAFYIGDGEEGIREIVMAAAGAKKEGAGREGMIGRIGAIGGVLVPSRGGVSGGGPAVRRRVYRGRELADPPRPLVPNIRIAQERIVIEVTRGCGNFCNFCHAGFWDLPYRRYDYHAITDRILEIADNTGYNEVTLSSLSISDYPDLAPLVNAVLPPLTARGISVSFPSLRVDTATLPIIEQISELRRASLTFAVESASEQIRARANKSVFLEDLLDIVRHVFARGWKVIKLYFMIGLPGSEEYDEAADIIGLLKEIQRAGGRGVDINVTVSPFVPKPHTPFQRERQMGRDYFNETVRRIKNGLPRSVRIKNHDLESSILEAVIARGDSRLGGVIEAAYRDGCRFDSWDEFFRYDVWEKNLDALMPGWNGTLGLRREGPLPWDGIETGFERLLEKRSEASYACAPPRKRAERPGGEVDMAPLEEARRLFARRFETAGRMRIRFAKTGMMRFIPHIDFMEIVKRALRMVGAPVAMTQGFNKRERISAGFPAPLGIESESELVDIDLYEDADEGLADRLNAHLPGGIAAVEARIIDTKASIMAETRVVEYRVSADREELAGTIIGGLESRPGFNKRTKKNERAVQFESVVHSHDTDPGGGLIIRLFTGSDDSVRIDEVVRVLCGLREGYPGVVRILKTAQFRISEGRLDLIR